MRGSQWQIFALAGPLKEAVKLCMNKRLAGTLDELPLLEH